jgi:hypothetical protein
MTEKNLTPIDLRDAKTAKCNFCGKRVSLVHKLKTNPLGRFRQHKESTGRSCWGTPVHGTERR